MDVKDRALKDVYDANNELVELVAFNAPKTRGECAVFYAAEAALNTRRIRGLNAYVKSAEKVSPSRLTLVEVMYMENEAARCIALPATSATHANLGRVHRGLLGVAMKVAEDVLREWTASNTARTWARMERDRAWAEGDALQWQHANDAANDADAVRQMCAEKLPLVAEVMSKLTPHTPAGIERLAAMQAIYAQTQPPIIRW